MTSLLLSRCGFSLVSCSGPRLAPAVVYGKKRLATVHCRAGGGEKDSNGEEPPESLFMKELRRRGMSSTSLSEDPSNRVDETNDSDIKMQDGGSSSSNKKNMISTDSANNTKSQRDLSMALNSEGLEGLIPRAKLLLTLGGTFFLGFSPLIFVTIALFAGLYFYFGSSFIHDASNAPVSPPPYIDPYVLLEEERLLQSTLK